MWNRRIALVGIVICAVVLALVSLRVAGPALMDALIRMHSAH